MTGIQIVVVLCVMIFSQLIIQRMERRREHAELRQRLDRLEASLKSDT